MTQQDIQLKQLITIFVGILIAFTPAINAAEKWSRQIEETDPGQVNTFSDWVPLAQPLDGSSKEREGRVLTYSQSFPPNGRFGELQKPQQTFDFPFQRFGSVPQHQQLRQQSQPIASALKSQEPTSQSFFKFEMPFHGDNTGRPLGGPPTLQTGYQIQHTFGGGAQATLFNSPYYNDQPYFPPEFHPLPHKPIQQPLQKQKPLHQQNYIDDTVPLKSTYRESKPQPTQHSLQSVTPQVFPADPQSDTAFHLNKQNTFQAQSSFAPGSPLSSADPTAPADLPQQQEVQLLYVPYDTLYNQQQQEQQHQQGAGAPAFEGNKFNLNSGLPAVNPYQINQFYTQDPLIPQSPNFFSSSTTSRPLTTSLKPSNVFQDFLPPQTTTAKPKPKAHQPPLAMFLSRSNSRPTQHDVVAILRNANTIAVIDAPTKNTPYIFVGPAGMPVPDGFAKFELPYLSQLTHSRDLSDVPFFVAPLSYRTPNGFHKILLPEPHVGSIVINRAKDIPANTNTYTSDNSQYQTTAPRTRPTHHRPKPTNPPKDLYSSNQYEVTTQRATLQPTRGNKFNYFYDQDQNIHEVHSPKANKHDRPKKKRPQNVQILQSNDNFFTQYQPNQLDNEQFYKLQTNKPTTSSTSTSTTSTTSTTTSTTPPPNFFTYTTTNPQIEFQSTKGQIYHDFNSVSKVPEASQEYAPRFTTRPPPTTITDDEYRMKQYYRQQDVFRNRPQFIHTTNSPFEQVQYTPVQVDYDREVNIPSTTHQTTTTTKHRVTYYTPSAAPTTSTEENFNTFPPRENVGEYGSPQPEQQSEKVIPSNHRPSYNQNEIPDGTVEYEPNPYQLPSELPPLTSNLPGLVNDLQDQYKLNANEQNTPAATTTVEPEPSTRPSRRPLNRIRKPVVTKVTSSVSYSESESSTKRPARPERVRRPYGTRHSAITSANTEDSENSSTTTRRPTAARNPLIRNPNRIRYQPTPEERQSLRPKHRKQGSSKKGNKDQEDLEYQRDVLKQNYPVFKGRKPTSPTAIPSSYAMTTTEGGTSETQQVYTVTPSNNIDQTDQTFPAGLLEPMQIAQHYDEYSKENYGPGYFPNQEDLNPTEPIYKNEINSVFTTTPITTSTTTTQRTTTTEELATTTRRSPFIRRNYPRLRTTTTEIPTTTTSAAAERPSTRSRIPPRKVIKVRARTRRPLHPASSTAAPEEDVPQEEVKSNNHRKLSRFNSDLYENDSPRRRYKTKFQLEGQESQWSPALKSQNHFQPLSSKETAEETQQKSEPEPEIVTAGPTIESEQDNKPENYEFNVSANFGSGSEQKTILKAPNLKPEKSFAELLEEVMGKAPEEQPLTANSDTRTTDGTYFESQKTTANDHLNRRGKWKKVKTTPSPNSESFETAESQNIGAHIFNSLSEQHKKMQSTTPLTTANTEETQMIATTSTPQSTISDFQLTTTTTSPITITQESDFMITTEKTQNNIEESTTLRQYDLETAASNDDLETQPSLFSEVKKQLHDLFSIDENEDDRAVTAALAAVGRRRQEYMNIKRERPATTTDLTPTDMITTEASISTTPTNDENEKAYHKNLMEHVVYATSTSTKVTSETEICYRGRCIRSEDLPSNHKLN